MARLQGIRLILAVRDLRAATDFYMDVLGFGRDFGDESDGWSWLSRDGFRVGLGECPDSVPATELGDHSYVAYVRVDDVDGLYAELVSRGAPVRSPPETKPWGMREIALRTPDGHRMTFGSPSSGAAVGSESSGHDEPLVDVFVLHHVHEIDEDDNLKLIGVYSSEQAANAAVARMSLQPGFREHPSGFQIDRYTVDEDNWTEGFVTIWPGDD